MRDEDRLPVLSLARWVARFGIDAPDDVVQVPDERWEPLLGLLVRQRLTGLALAASLSDRLQISAEAEAQLFASQREAMLHCLSLERTLVDVSARFEAAGIDLLVLKGSALAHGAYPDPSWRPFGDLDILVSAADWAHACSILQGMGFARDLPEPRPGFDLRFGKAATHTGPGGVQIDLHRRLALGPFGLWIEPDAMFEHTATFALGPRSLRRPNDSATFLHACIHAALGWRPPLLLPLRDVIQAEALPDVRPDVVAALGRRWKIGAVVAYATQEASRLAKDEHPRFERLTAWIDISSAERQALRAYTTPRRKRGGMASATLRAIPGVVPKWAYLRDLIFPSRAFLDARTSGAVPGSYLRRWMVAGRKLSGRGGAA